MLLGFGAVARATVELAEPQVAVGHKGAHAQFVGQRQGLAVVLFGTLHFSGIAMRGDLAEEPLTPRLMPPFPVVTSEIERAQTLRPGVVDPAGPEIGLAEWATRIGCQKRNFRDSAAPTMASRIGSASSTRSDWA